MDQTLTRPLIIDNGSYQTKVGFAGDQEPTLITSTLAGSKLMLQETFNRKKSTVNICEVFFGDQIREDMEWIRPLKNGKVVQKDYTLKLWKHILKDKLKLSLRETPILITDNKVNDLSNRQDIAELMFEKLEVPALYFEYPSVLALFSMGKSTGLSLDIGYECSHTCGVYEGLVYDETKIQENIGGQKVTRDMAQSLKSIIQYPFHERDLLEICNEIKEKYCFANSPQDQVKESSSCKSKSIKMPDGSIIQIQNERYEAVESLIEPIKNMVKNSYSKTVIKEQLLQNLTISGGTVNIRNLPERLAHEIFREAPVRNDVNLSYSQDPSLDAWKGGALLGALNAFKTVWVTRHQYLEEGLEKLATRFL